MHTKWSLEVGIFSSPLNFLEACLARTNTPKRITKENKKEKKNQTFLSNGKTFIYFYVEQRERLRETEEKEAM
jgi:hypothetical protein